MFLKLAPESVRLRRLARALTAGEISEAEYRRARREIIDAFTAAAADGTGTARRPDDDTVRRSEAEKALAGRPAAAVEGAAQGPRRRPWLLVIAVVVLAALLSVPLTR